LPDVPANSRRKRCDRKAKGGKKRGKIQRNNPRVSEGTVPDTSEKGARANGKPGEGAYVKGKGSYEKRKSTGKE